MSARSIWRDTCITQLLTNIVPVSLQCMHPVLIITLCIAIVLHSLSSSPMCCVKYLSTVGTFALAHYMIYAHIYLFSTETVYNRTVLLQMIFHATLFHLTGASVTLYRAFSIMILQYVYVILVAKTMRLYTLDHRGNENIV